MATKKKTSVPPDKLELHERLVVAAGMNSKSNFGSAYTARNGNMCSMISKYGVVGIRRPEAERDAFLDEHDAEVFRADPSWPPSKEYVAVPDASLEDTEILRPYLERSCAYVKALKPKPKRKR
ncbi:MAG: hypothetical protein IIC70_03030 [Acidobacteria bacterium]|nr:hypothetical protein [Acidobacteriota bacterium]